MTNNPICCGKESKVVTLGVSIEYFFCDACRKEVVPSITTTSAPALKPSDLRHTYSFTNSSSNPVYTTTHTDRIQTINSNLQSIPTKIYTKTCSIQAGKSDEILREWYATFPKAMDFLDSPIGMTDVHAAIANGMRQEPEYIPQEQVDAAVEDLLSTLDKFAYTARQMAEINTLVLEVSLGMWNQEYV